MGRKALPKSLASATKLQVGPTPPLKHRLHRTKRPTRRQTWRRTVHRCSSHDKVFLDEPRCRIPARQIVTVDIVPPIAVQIRDTKYSRSVAKCIGRRVVIWN